MKGYLGEYELSICESKFAGHTPMDWAMLWIDKYGQIEGAHHKTWLIDQIKRILCGTDIIVMGAQWESGHEEMRFSLKSPSDDYLEFIKEYEEDGEYSWDCGIAP